MSTDEGQRPVRSPQDPAPSAAERERRRKRSQFLRSAVLGALLVATLALALYVTYWR